MQMKKQSLLEQWNRGRLSIFANRLLQLKFLLMGQSKIDLVIQQPSLHLELKFYFFLKQFYQQQHKHVHLKGTTDMISSVGIPLAMAAGAIGLLAMGLKDLATGSNKKDGF